ncbi:MAG: ATP-binding cassette domain-containing protein [Flavobacteriales bacterium]|nr:ATP-binding cassette domain-containing protein [Flavobacteriales bacterium]
MSSAIHIDLHDLGKRYHKEWIFKGVSTSFQQNSSTGIIGSNGSGKSTLLKLISAAELCSKGSITYQLENKVLEQENLYLELSFAAPYIDLIEELSCQELIEFHLKFKSFQENVGVNQFLDLTYLNGSKDKLIRNFSSGMKQRLKLGLAICTQSSLLLLDEPCSNLDEKGVQTYHELMDNFNQNRTTIIGSNEQKDELYQIENTLRISDYK